MRVFTARRAFGAILGAWTASAALAGCTGEIGPNETDTSAGGGDALPAFSPAAPTLHRLTTPQLENAWVDLLGEPLTIPDDLPADDVLYGFSSIAASSSTISSVDAEKYEAATYAVLDQIWADPTRLEALVGCGAPPFAMNDVCVTTFISEFAVRAWRRPLADGELGALFALGTDVAASLGDGTKALEFTLAAVLLSPHFLFRVELGEPTIGPSGEPALRYTAWEMASRLSFLVTDGPPDDALLGAAASGELDDPAVLREHAERLLDDPRARKALVRFFREFMMVRNLDQLDKNAEKFPQLTTTLGPSMRVEIERMFENVVFEERADFREIFTTRETYLNEDLARIYGIEGITGADFTPVTLPDDGRRGGLLTTPGFLAMNAHQTQTSPTHRGRFIQINLLCNDIPPPPPGVDTTLPEPEPGAPQTTLRQRLDEHRDDPACAGCHMRMDPLGFAFENYDALGVYREVDENGLPIDASAELEDEPLVGGVAMGAAVAELPEALACVARRFYEHAGAHLAGDGDERSVHALVESFVADDYDFRELVIALVVNDGFRFASLETEEVKP
ncbi:MAG: DUF1592 domain-containing protein [Polyangiaceae bacterium]